MGMRKKVTKAEYLEFFRQVLAGLEDDFPNRFLDEVRLQGPLAAGRLQILDAEQVAFSLKSVWSDGTYQIVLSPDELLEKLAALVPPPRLNLVRYHGVLAPNAVDRAQIVPGPKEEVKEEVKERK